jgi:hypothetical protein
MRLLCSLVQLAMLAAVTVWLPASAAAAAKHSKSNSLDAFLYPYKQELLGSCEAADDCEAADCQIVHSDLAGPCEHCRRQQAGTLAPVADEESKLAPNDPVKLILEFMLETDASVLRGTAFDPAEPTGACTGNCQHEERQIVIRCVRNLEANQQHAACRISAAASPISVAEDGNSADVVVALRKASRQLEESANLLEDQRLYNQADELREMATELRHQARVTGPDIPAKPLNYSEPIRSAPAWYSPQSR